MKMNDSPIHRANEPVVMATIRGFADGALPREDLWIGGDDARAIVAFADQAQREAFRDGVQWLAALIQKNGNDRIPRLLGTSMVRDSYQVVEEAERRYP